MKILIFTKSFFQNHLCGSCLAAGQPGVRAEFQRQQRPPSTGHLSSQRRPSIRQLDSFPRRKTNRQKCDVPARRPKRIQHVLHGGQEFRPAETKRLTRMMIFLSADSNEGLFVILGPVPGLYANCLLKVPTHNCTGQVRPTADFSIRVRATARGSAPIWMCFYACVGV